MPEGICTPNFLKGYCTATTVGHGVRLADFASTSSTHRHLHANLLLQAALAYKGSSKHASLRSATEGVAHAGKEQDEWVTF